MSRLLKQVAKEQDAALANDAALQRVGERLRRADFARAPGARLRWAPAVALAAVVLLVSGLVLRLAGGSRPVALLAPSGPVASGGVVDATAGEQGCRFSDGSTLLAREGARVRLLESRPAGATLMIERGATSVFVQPRKDTDYRFEAGPFAVLVTGTRFDLSWDPGRERLELVMQSGAVELRGPGLGPGRTVVAGQSVVLEPERRALAPTAAAPAPPLPDAPPDAPRDEPSAAPTAPAPSASASERGPGPKASAAAEDAVSWRDLHRQGKYREAWELVSPTFDALVGSASAGDLLQLADVARLAGKGGSATTALESLRKRFPRTPEAASAAFHLGRAAGAGQAAAGYFRAYLAEAPGGPFAREALGRLLESLHRSGDRAGAASVAKQYLASYPKGPHAELAGSYVSDTPK